MCDKASAIFFSWQQIGAVDGDHRFTVFYFGKPHVACLIPKNAFSEPADAERFQQLAIDLHAEVHQQQPTSAASPETGNPYQPPTAY